MQQLSELDITTLRADAIIEAHPEYQEVNNRLQSAEGELREIAARLNELWSMDHAHMTPAIRTQFAVEFGNNRDAMIAAIRECERARSILAIEVMEAKARKYEVLYEALSPFIELIEAEQVAAKRRMQRVNHLVDTIVAPCKGYRQDAERARKDAKALQSKLEQLDTRMAG